MSSERGGFDILTKPPQNLSLMDTGQTPNTMFNLIGYILIFYFYLMMFYKTLLFPFVEESISYL